jgi:hypothetical protein
MVCDSLQKIRSGRQREAEMKEHADVAFLASTAEGLEPRALRKLEAGLDGEVEVPMALTDGDVRKLSRVEQSVERILMSGKILEAVVEARDRISRIKVWISFSFLRKLPRDRDHR